MFHHDFRRLSGLDKKFSEKLESNTKTINQDISIRDIFIYPFSRLESYGESKKSNSNYHNINVTIRLFDHIDLLASIANKYHEKFFCDKNEQELYIVKKDCLNKITRILLNEFSLYTDKPIKHEDFSYIINAIYCIAKTKQPNVHLLLSSFSVALADNTLLNFSLYVECGKQPKIHSFCKARPSHSDVSYNDTTHFSQQSLNNSASNVSEYIASFQGKIVSNNSVFLIQTLGGAQYLQGIDVCFDHEFQHAKRLILSTLTNENPQFIPDKVDHVLTSNSLPVQKHARVTEVIAHIDSISDFANHMENDVVTLGDLAGFNIDIYYQMFMEESINGFVVNNPPFGFSYQVVAAEERSLKGFYGELKQMAESKNNKIKKNFIELSLKKASRSERYLQLKQEVNQITHNLKMLKLINSHLLLYSGNILELANHPSASNINDVVKNIDFNFFYEIKKQLFSTTTFNELKSHFYSYPDESVVKRKLKSYIRGLIKTENLVQLVCLLRFIPIPNTIFDEKFYHSITNDSGEDFLCNYEEYTKELANCLNQLLFKALLDEYKYYTIYNKAKNELIKKSRDSKKVELQKNKCIEWICERSSLPMKDKENLVKEWVSIDKAEGVTEKYKNTRMVQAVKLLYKQLGSQLYDADGELNEFLSIFNIDKPDLFGLQYQTIKFSIESCDASHSTERLWRVFDSIAQNPWSDENKLEKMKEFIIEIRSEFVKPKSFFSFFTGGNPLLTELDHFLETWECGPSQTAFKPAFG